MFSMHPDDYADEIALADNPGCEFRNAFELSRSEYTPKVPDPREVDRLFAMGYHVVAVSHLDHCAFTDAVLGESIHIAHVAPSRAAAQAWINMDEWEGSDERYFLL